MSPSDLFREIILCNNRYSQNKKYKKVDQIARLFYANLMFVR